MRDLPPRGRSTRPPWAQALAERLTPAIKAFVIADAFIYAFYVFVPAARASMLDHLAIGPRLWSGEVWQPLTSLFFDFDLLGFIFNLIGLWFVGAMIERTQGTRRLVTLFLGAGVAANLVFAGVSRLGHSGEVSAGCSLAVLALFVAVGRIYGRAPMHVLGGLYVQAKNLAWIFVAWGVLYALYKAAWAYLAATLAASVIGYLGAAPGGFREGWAALKLRRLRRRYRVIDGGAARPPKRPKQYWN